MALGSPSPIGFSKYILRCSGAVCAKAGADSTSAEMVKVRIWFMSVPPNSSVSVTMSAPRVYVSNRAKSDSE
jgi:hypothetical protein